MKKLIPAAVASAWALPLLVFAQDGADDIFSLAETVTNIINGVLVPLVFALAFIVFIWGVFRFFIAGADDEKAKDNAKRLIVMGLIGFFVMVSVWGLVNILVGTFELDSSTVPTLPDAPAPEDAG